MTALTLNVFSKSLLSLLRNFGSVETAAGFYAFFFFKCSSSSVSPFLPDAGFASAPAEEGK